MKIFRARHNTVPESPVRTLYGRKGNLLLVPLDICILQMANGIEEFRPPLEVSRLITAPVQDLEDGRLGVIAGYDWPPQKGESVNPVVTIQLAPSGNVKGIPDLRVLASQLRVGDLVFLSGEDVEQVVFAVGRKTVNPDSVNRVVGTIVSLTHLQEYPDLEHRVIAHAVEFQQHLDPTVRGAAVRRESGELVGMLISTQNQPDGVCRALVYPT